MALVMTPIYTQTVGASAVFTIGFNNIPQFYTDLMVKFSGRDTNSATATNLFFRLNGDTGNNYSITRLQGNGSAASSDRTSTTNVLQTVYNAATSTSNTFSSIDIYLPNYTSSNFKSCLIDTVTENNASAANQELIAGLYRSTNAITSLQILAGIQFVQNTTASLYGIIRSGA